MLQTEPIVGVQFLVFQFKLFLLALVLTDSLPINLELLFYDVYGKVVLLRDLVYGGTYVLLSKLDHLDQVKMLALHAFEIFLQ